MKRTQNRGFRPRLEVLEDRWCPSGAGSEWSDPCNAVVVQTDGKILAAGQTGGNFVVVRYNSNLTLDTSFGSGGFEATAIGSGAAAASSIALQADGKSVLAGTTSVFHRVGPPGIGYRDDNFAVARYTTSGVLDTTFGGGTGYVITDVSKGNFTFSSKNKANPSANNEAAAVAIDSSGRIVVVGRASTFNDIYGESGDAAFVVARYTSTGALDTTFNSGGRMPGTVVSFPTNTGWNSLSSVVIQADGKIVVGGTVGCCGNGKFALERYNPNGTLDSTFGSGGIVILPLIVAPGGGNTSDSLSGLALDAAGNIVASGTGGGFLLARFTPSGALDPTFNGTGYVSTNIRQITGNGGSSGGASSVAINPSNGKIAVGGTQFQANSPNEMTVVQYNPDGSLDTTFNGTGILTYVFPNAFNDAGHPVAYDTAGHIVLGGENDVLNSDGISTAPQLAMLLIDPISGAITSTITDTTPPSGSTTSSTQLQSANSGTTSSNATSTTPGNGQPSPTATGSSGAESQDGIWPLALPMDGTRHHTPFGLTTVGSLWAEQVLGAIFPNELLVSGL
jgi:uncharacterized delta-60 repeat protein